MAGVPPGIPGGSLGLSGPYPVDEPGSKAISLVSVLEPTNNEQDMTGSITAEMAKGAPLYIEDAPAASKAPGAPPKEK